MAERIAEEKVNEIRQAVEIVDVIGDYVQLKKQGRNYFGLCPFHGENSPSFSVSPDKQIYHCFGCGAGGNVFSFLMDIDGLSFQEAAVKLAERANVELQLEGPSVNRSPRLPEGSKQIEAHELLRKFYHHLLVNTKEGQAALEYLLNRGFTMESIDRFQIGYALPSWDFVSKLLEKRGFPLELIEKAGLVIQREKDGTYFDRFRDRIMFPILDHQGNTIAFSGRSLGGEEPKYLNSPETQIFNKSKVLYNFHLARASIRKQQQAVLFEGFADVISANRAGVENGVATMGTSLTDEQIVLLKRNVQAVTICYDSDKAGIEAAFRASNMLSKAGFAVRVATMPDGMDPDDFIKAHGEEKFKNDIIGSSATLMAFKLIYYRRGKNLQHEGDRLQYIEEVLKEISALDKAVEKDMYLRQLANEFSLSLDALVQQQNQLSQAFSPKKQNQPRPEKNPVIITRKAELKPAYHTAERRLIFHMMRNADIAYKVQEMLEGNTLNIDEHQAIITYLFAYYEKGHDPDPSAFLNYLQDNKLKRVVADIEMMPLNEELSDQELSDYIKQVLNYQKMLKIKEKMAEQKQAERQNDILRAAAIATEIIQLRKTL
ncbi:DNA primase [Mesobacillus subterraneus]|uniref:DNA primase n=1 Tax=Mesobacillus subterraneus TaxID=285983 RepID=UPI0020417757|nr:DNA primase [Mesobacillus subterraneus]MCM3663974.1 DNA primase [Mesobacillus subterraneus]MCM3683733.1 DNA primase [Mesobacillus subterraneus]